MVGNNEILKKHTAVFKLLPSLFFVAFCFFHGQLSGQTSNSDFERIKLNYEGIEFSGIVLSPDLKNIAISTKDLAPVLILDWKSKKVIHEFNAGNWHSGSKISYSENGKYLLLQELEYKDFSLNKPRKIAFEIIESETGKLIRKFENVQDVLISADEKYVVSLEEESVNFTRLTDGSKEKVIHVPGAANAIALSPDGKLLAVSQKASPDILKSTFSGDKKSTKVAEKTRQMVSFCDVEKGTIIKTVTELYEIIYKLKFSRGGELLIVSQTPEVSTQVANKKISYFNLVDAVTTEPLRRGFTSMSIDQPAIHFSNNRQFFAINSKGQKFQEIHLYDSETATLQKRFEMGKRIFEKVEGEKLFSDSRPSFTFLPGDESILIAIGNQLIIWNFNIEE